MIIKYKRKRLRFHLIFGLFWLVYFFVSYFIKPYLSWIDYGWLVISAAYLFLYYDQVKKEYGKIENDILIINRPLRKGKEIDLKQATGVRKFAGDYTFTSGTKTLKVNTELIDPASLKQLNDTLKTYVLNWS